MGGVIKTGRTLQGKEEHHHWWWEWLRKGGRAPRCHSQLQRPADCGSPSQSCCGSDPFPHCSWCPQCAQCQPRQPQLRSCSGPTWTTLAGLFTVSLCTWLDCLIPHKWSKGSVWRGREMYAGVGGKAGLYAPALDQIKRRQPFLTSKSWESLLPSSSRTAQQQHCRQVKGLLA